LEQGKNVVHEPIFETKGAAYTEINDIGDSYVECDLGQQHIYVYIDGKVVMESDCVSGSVASGRETPEGVYEISLVKTPAILIGEDYETPVTFWMPFTNNGIGFHDATWRSKFGGEIYRSSGSHGCVNLPYAAAQELFNIAYVGLPVVCYY
jgi:lipoprotein-anchoring transpeptidase ErfK/SrfK